jgi:hypothetical protein
MTDKSSRLQSSFEAILPTLRLHGRVYFRHVKCQDRKEEAIAETIALCWKWHVRLAERGKDATRFPTTLASLAARAVRNGRRVCGQESARDALSAAAQRRHNFAAYQLPDGDNLGGNLWDDALIHNTHPLPEEQAAFRIDFAAWLLTWSDRDRRIISDMAMNERTRDLARKFGVSPGRISQKRREYHASWRQFHGEPAAGRAGERTRNPV